MNDWKPVEIGKSGAFILTAIQPDEAAELAELAKGKSVLEIGAAHGYSAIIMAQHAVSVFSVDDHCGTSWLGDTRAIMQSNLALFKIYNVQICAQSDRDALPNLARVGFEFDLIFIDGDGEFDSVLFDLEMALFLLKVGGTIAVHDYDHPLYPDKRKACDKIFPNGPDKLVGSLFIKHI